MKPGGLSGATRRSGALIVSALLAVNAFGDVDRDGSALSSAADRLESAGDGSTLGTEGTFANTTIGVVVTNAALDKTGCLIVAQGGHGGLSRSLVPAHTRVDGDGLVAAATGEVETDVDTVRVLAAAAVEDAVRHLG